MPRILLWIMILLGVFMLMRGCQKPPQLPSAVSIERVPLGDEGSEYRDGNISLWLDADGNVVSLTQGDELILAPVPPWRRMLRVRLLSGGVVLPMRGGWKGQDGEGGVDFVWEGEDGTIIQKRIRVADDRRGLRISLVITRGEGGPEAATFTVLSGLSPGEEDGGNPGGAITAFGGGTELISFLSLERRQAAARLLGDPLPIGSTRDLRAGQKAARIGLLGPSSAIEVQGLEGPLTLTLEAYRTQRSDRLQNEIEGWLTLPCKPNAPSRWEYELRWSTREEMLVKEPTLRDRSEFQPSSTHTLENGTLIVRLTDRGAAILDATLKGFTQRPNQEPGPDTWIPILRGGVPRGLRSLTLIIQDRERFPGLQATEEALWTLTDSGATWAVYELAAPSGWRVRKTIALPPEGNYALQVTITVIAPEGAEEDTVTYELIGPAGSYIADAYSGITMQDPPQGVRLERRGGEDDDDSLDTIQDEALSRNYDRNERGLLKTLGTRGGYFIAALNTELRLDRVGALVGTVGRSTIESLTLRQPVERPDGEESRDSMRASIICTVPFSAGEATQTFRLYLGPNERGALDEIDSADAVDYRGFNFLALALMAIMKFFHGLTGSMGLAVILMTVVVRGGLSPISYKNMLSMQRYSKRIQKIKPILDELEKKYGKNKQKMNQERLKVMREHKIGLPLGCLMMLVQLPIWIALFGALRVEFVLRQAPFLWVEDLSMPDRLFALGFEIPLLGGYFNLLPILMLVLWVWQQKAQPQPTDPQMAAQMKMVKFMPYMFFFFLYNYAAALALYMCVSSIWGIVEGKLVRKAIAKMD